LTKQPKGVERGKQWRVFQILPARPVRRDRLKQYVIHYRALMRERLHPSESLFTPSIGEGQS
jgi:hypothetical protein